MPELCQNEISVDVTVQVLYLPAQIFQLAKKFSISIFTTCEFANILVFYFPICQCFSFVTRHFARAELELEKEAREEAEAHAALLTEQRELEGKR